MDSRARQTRIALAEALIRLVPQKGFAAISVEELARAAEIGRSTFYGHYSSKADFLDRSLSDMLWAMNRDAWRAPPGPLLPVRPFCSHVTQVRAFADELVASGEFDSLFARKEDTLRAIAEANLTHPAIDSPHERRRETAIMLAGAYTALLRWWVRGGMRATPEAMQDWFDRFAAASLSETGAARRREA